MVGFLVDGVFVVVDKLVFGDALAAWAVPLFVATVLLTLLCGIGWSSLFAVWCAVSERDKRGAGSVR